MPTGSVDFVDFNELKPLLPGTTLGAANVDLSLVKASVKAPFSLAPGIDLNFGVNAGAQLTLQVLNENRPDTPDRVVAAAGTRTPEAIELPPQIALTGDHAWLKYRVDAEVTTKGSAAAGWFGAEGSAGATVICSDYRCHPRDAIVVSAVEQDVLARPRFAVSLDDVRDLAEGDAVSLQVAGNLVASVTLMWSDIFASQIGTLTRAVSSASPIGIRTLAGATVTTSVKLADSFLLVFSKAGPSQWRVGLKKGTVRTVDLGAEAGVTVQIDNPEDVTRILDGILGDLLGKAYVEVTALAASKGFNEADLTALTEVFRRLGLSAAPTPADLQKALGKFQADVRDRIERIVKEKVSLAFNYEYQRIASDATLFQALLTKDGLAEHHGTLVRGSLASVVAAARANPTGPVTAEVYLNERTVKTSRAYGFTLGVGKWKASGKDRSELTAIRRQSQLDNHEQRSYVGLGSYTGSVFGETRTWQADFAAATPRFSVGAVPAVNEYQLGLTLSCEETDRKFDGSDLDQAVDFAVLWSVCSAGGADALRDLLRPAMDKANVEWSVHLRINDEALRAIVPVIAGNTRTQFAGPMAAALRATARLGVRDVAQRRLTYEPVWTFYLAAAEQATPHDVAMFAANRLRQAHPEAANLEEQFAHGGGADRLLTAGGTCDLNGNARANVDDFIRGARVLAAAFQRNDPDLGVLSSAYKQMRKLWTQSHQVRALGVRLVDAAIEAGALKGVERTLTVIVGGESVTVSSNQPGTR